MWGIVTLQGYLPLAARNSAGRASKQAVRQTFASPSVLSACFNVDEPAAARHGDLGGTQTGEGRGQGTALPRVDAAGLEAVYAGLAGLGPRVVDTLWSSIEEVDDAIGKWYPETLHNSLFSEIAPLVVASSVECMADTPRFVRLPAPVPRALHLHPLRGTNLFVPALARFSASSMLTSTHAHSPSYALGWAHALPPNQVPLPPPPSERQRLPFS